MARLKDRKRQIKLNFTVKLILKIYLLNYKSYCLNGNIFIIISALILLSMAKLHMKNTLALKTPSLYKLK